MTDDWRSPHGSDTKPLALKVPKFRQIPFDRGLTRRQNGGDVTRSVTGETEEICTSRRVQTAAAVTFGSPQPTQPAISGRIYFRARVVCSISRDSTLSSAAVADLRASLPLERPLTSLRSQRYGRSHSAPHCGTNNFLGVDFRLPSSPESDHASSSARVRSDSDDGRRV